MSAADAIRGTPTAIPEAPFCDGFRMAALHGAIPDVVTDLDLEATEEFRSDFIGKGEIVAILDNQARRDALTSGRIEFRRTLDSDLAALGLKADQTFQRKQDASRRGRMSLAKVTPACLEAGGNFVRSGSTCGRFFRSPSCPWAVARKRAADTAAAMVVGNLEIMGG